MLLAVWAMLTIAVLVLMVVADLNRARSQLDQLGSSLLQHVSDRSLVSETALEAFAAYVASLDRFDHERARSFARSLLARYPFLYMFELAVRVDATERAGVERRLAGRYPGFEIRQFTYQADRRWQTAEPAEFYYPLVFQEPLLDGPANVIGLDIYANELLRQAMATSFMRGQPVTTHPFDLAEGGRGYVLHRSVDNLGGRPPSAFEAREYALLALKTADLIPAPFGVPPGVTVRLVHQDFAFDDPAGEVMVMHAQPATAAEALVLPRFHRRLVLDLASQPLQLGIDWQLGWKDVSLKKMAAVAIGSLLLLWGVRVYAQHFIESELSTLEQEGRLFELANFDSLTGLANRNRLIDFLESALARARRHRLQLAVLFIDLDGFKAVNDVHGHASGDLVLIEVAQRLGRHQREDELLARYGGDEFVWVTEGTAQRPELDGLVPRLRRDFETPFATRGVEVQLGVSIGCAIYPRDGRNIAALFEAADAEMYRDKRDKARTLTPSPTGPGHSDDGRAME